jgi:hypothetical protein
MKKIWVFLVIGGVLALALGAASVVNAQAPVNTPQVEQGGGQGGFGARAAGCGERGENEEVQKLMLNAWSDALGISVEELSNRKDAGENLAQIALSTGRTFEEFRALRVSVHTSVAEQALKAGIIDQAQYQCHLKAVERQMHGRGNGSRPADGHGFTTRGAGDRARGHHCGGRSANP